MRIGVVCVIGSKFFNKYLNKEQINILEDNLGENDSPAVCNLILSFLNNDHFIRVFTLANTNFRIITPNLEIYGIGAYNTYPYKYLWGCFINASRINNILKDSISDLEVLHAHWTYFNSFGAMPFASQIPVFCTVRDWAKYILSVVKFKDKISWLFLYIMNEIVFRNKEIHFVANSPYTGRLIKNKIKKNVPIIQNSINSQFVKKDEPQKFKDVRVLCIFSSNDKRKNIDTLVRAFRLFRQKCKNSKLILIGPISPDDGNFKKWKTNGLLDGVKIVGSVSHNDLPQYIDQSSMFVNPSLEETFGNTLIECFARKIPVVGGEKSGAIPFVLHHGAAGFLCDVSSPESICKTMIYVNSNPDVVREKVNNAYHIVNTEFSENTVYNLYLLEYKKVIFNN